MILDAAGPLTTIVAADFTLRKVFAVPVNWSAKLWETVQLTNETVSQFYARLRLIVIKSMSSNVHLNIASIDELCLFHFRRNTRPEISQRLSWVMPSTIDAALSIAANVEQEESEVASKGKPKKIAKIDSLCLVETDESKKQDSDYHNRFKQLNDKMTSLTSTVNSMKQSAPQATSPLDDHNLQSLVTSLRDLKDTMTRTPNSSRAPNSNERDQNYRHRGSSSFKCHHCQKPGHSYNYCYSASEDQKAAIREKFTLNHHRATSSSRKSPMHK
jgi:hypothetical protein